ncbi:hypothetical protein QMG52_06160 [Paenarthrobacter sp. PH39-S1]|nr:hypothetical protein [Paenarthrobacter sp. PH39-S1]MDJ0355690.1 hypothetical protein [Paenarthrobacter sp. PH39-S1]
MEEKPAGQGHGVNLVGKGTEPDPGGLELVGERAQVLDVISN